MDILIGGEGEFVPFVGIAGGAGIIIDTGDLMQCAFFESHGPAVGLSGGVGLQGGVIGGEAEGDSINIDINAGGSGGTGVITAPDANPGGVYTFGPGGGASVSSETCRTYTLEDLCNDLFPPSPPAPTVPDSPPYDGPYALPDDCRFPGEDCTQAPPSEPVGFPLDSPLVD